MLVVQLLEPGIELRDELLIPHAFYFMLIFVVQLVEVLNAVFEVLVVAAFSWGTVFL
jgi:hypothetical protein